MRLNHLAATNVVAPAIARRLVRDGWAVSQTTGAETAVRRQSLGVAKSHWVDAACVAAPRENVSFRCSRALSIHMIGRGRRLVVNRDAFGFPRERSDGSDVASHRKTPPHGVRCGDVVRIDKPGLRVRRRTGTVTTARWDGRCVVKHRSGERINVMASRLAIIHRDVGARIE